MDWIEEDYGSAILVDVNGFKKPNKFGRDRIVFQPTTPDHSLYTSGIPTLLQPIKDYPNVDTYCKSGNCFYTSWLLQ